MREITMSSLVGSLELLALKNLYCGRRGDNLKMKGGEEPTELR